MIIDKRVLLSDAQDTGTSVATVASTDILDLRNATPAKTANPNVNAGGASSWNPLAPAVEQNPLQIGDGENFEVFVMANNLESAPMAGTGTVTIQPVLQASDAGTNWDTLVAGPVVPAARWIQGLQLKLSTNIPGAALGAGSISFGTKYNFLRVAYVLAGTTITVSAKVTAFVQPD